MRILICVFELRKIYIELRKRNFDYEKDIVFERVGCGVALCLH